MIVMKFGGTSVGSPQQIQKVSKIVASQLDQNPLIVVSALSGVTNLLVELSHAKEKAPILKNLLERHETVLAELNLDKNLLHTEFEELQSLMSGVELLQECTQRTQDRILSFGEHCSSKILAAFLNQTLDKPVKAICSYELGLRTDSRFGKATPLDESKENILYNVKNHAQEIIVTTGFIAKDLQDNLTTLGRGGSDFSAAYIGAAIGATEIQIWTDVSGMMTADPKIVENVKHVESLSFEEASELAYYGAKVLHPSTMIPAIEKNIPVRILNTNFPDHPGTFIYKDTQKSKSVVKAIAHRDGLTVINITTPRMLNQHGFLAKIFDVFRDHKVSVDMVSTSEISVSLTISDHDPIAAIVQDLHAFSKVTVEKGLSVVSVVGEGVREDQNIPARVFTVLQKENIPVRMISLGASKINLSFLVDSEFVKKSVKGLHQAFFV